MQFKWLQIFCLCAAIQFQFIEGNPNPNFQKTNANQGEPSSNKTETQTDPSAHNEPEAEPQNSETTTHSGTKDDNRVWGVTPHNTTTTSPVEEGEGLWGSQSTNHICTRFTEYYDCQIRDVHLKKGVPSIFGLPRNNSQQNVTFLHSTLEYLPKSLIDAFPYASLLNLNDLKIESIDPNAFEHAAYLKTVYLEGNRLIRIDRDAFRGANNLQMLVLSKNKIAFIDNQPFGNNRLQHLYLDQNQLNTLPSFTNTAELQFLNASHNNLSTIDDWHFRQLTYLQTLDLSFNRLERLNLQQLNVYLELVDVSSNDLNDFVMPKRVKFLYARNNSLTKFEVGPQCELRVVDIAHNKLKTQPTFEYCRSLEHLDLSYNLLEKFAYKVSMDKLQYISLAHNNLFEIQLPTLSTKTKPLATSLITLDLSYNKLTHITSLDAFKKLERLHLNNNNLIKFDKAFKPFIKNPIKEYLMANNEWDCDDIEHFESKTMDKHNNQCAQGQENKKGICCRAYSTPYNDRLNEVLREADFHERANQKNCPKQEPATSNQRTYLDEIHNAMANADTERRNKWQEIVEVQAQQNNFKEKLQDFQNKQNRLTNSKHTVAREIETQRKSHRVIKEGLISDKVMLERIIKFVQERDAFNKDLLSRRKKDTEESKRLLNEKQREFGELNRTIEKLKNDITSLKKVEKEKKREKDLAEKRANKNSASIHGSSGTISQ